MSTESTDTRQNNAENRRGRPFPKGHSGRPRGTRNKTRLALEILLEGEGEALTRKAVQLALGGDVTALRLCLDRILPPRKDRYVPFALPPLESAADAVKATAALVEGVASGALTPSEAGELAKLERFRVTRAHSHSLRDSWRTLLA
jgi:hypothetical protein